MFKRRTIKTIFSLFSKKELEGNLTEREFAELVMGLKKIDEALGNKEKKKVAKEIGKIIKVLLDSRIAHS